MRPRRQTRPTGAPPIHINGQAFQFESIIDGNDAIDLAVGVFVVLTRVDVRSGRCVEVHGRDGHVERLRGGEGDLLCCAVRREQKRSARTKGREDRNVVPEKKSR